ncbi:MAG: energy transducer TonB [Rhodoferax sp.]
MGQDYERGSPGVRRGLLVGVLAAHLLGAWGLLQVGAVRQAVGEAVPLVVEMIRPLTPPPPAPLPRAQKSIPVPSAPAPMVAATPLPQQPEPLAPVAPAPSAAPVPPRAHAEPAPVPSEASAPVALASAAPAPPKTIPATAVQYLEPPAPNYPAASRRLGESGRVLIRVEIDTAGQARQVQLLRSSGSKRLDDAALAAVRAARFKPFTEKGEPQVVWTTVPIVFELES